ncbi:hemin ABC transporter substrate-binding protein [Leptospira sp. WS92.C1]
MKFFIFSLIMLTNIFPVFSQNNPIRIVTLNGPITETVFALGKGNSVVGCDTSSVYPEKTNVLPKIGYQRTLSTEGILSLKPDLIIGTDEAGPPEVLEQLKNAGLKVEILSSKPGVEPSLERILNLGKIINKNQEAQTLVKEIRSKLANIEKEKRKDTTFPKILFLYSRGQHLAHVSGTSTAADTMIQLAGGKNAITEFSGFKPLTPEAVISSAPDLILIPSRGFESLGGTTGLLALPGVSETPAGKNKRIIQIDDLILLGFGPRFVNGIEDIRKELISFKKVLKK